MKKKQAEQVNYRKNDPSNPDQKCENCNHFLQTRYSTKPTCIKNGFGGHHLNLYDLFLKYPSINKNYVCNNFEERQR